MDNITLETNMAISIKISYAACLPSFLLQYSDQKPLDKAGQGGCPHQREEGCSSPAWVSRLNGSKGARFAMLRASDVGNQRPHRDERVSGRVSTRYQSQSREKRKEGPCTQG